MANVAVAIARGGRRVHLVTRDYSNPCRDDVEALLRSQGVTWRRVGPSVPMPEYAATLGEDKTIIEDRFCPNAAYDFTLAPGLPPSHLLLACTDFSSDVLDSFALHAHDVGAEFWITVSDSNTASVLNEMNYAPDLITLNEAESHALVASSTAGSLGDLTELLVVAVPRVQRVVVTLGPRGAVLVDYSNAGRKVRVRPPRAHAGEFVGTGDALAGALAAARIAGLAWEAAIGRANDIVAGWIQDRAQTGSIGGIKSGALT